MAGGSVMRIGVLRNPRSERNRRRGRVSEAAGQSDIIHVDLDAFVDLPSIVAAFAECNVGLIVVDGGDGTIQAVITEVIVSGRFATLPRFAIVASGMTNLISKDVGMRGRGRSVIQCLAAADDRRLDAATITRPVIRLDMTVGGAPRRIYGMFFGAAALYHGTQFGLNRVHRLRIRHGAAAAVTLATVSACAALGRGDQALLEGNTIGLTTDSRITPVESRFLFMTTTLRRLLFGMAPFWGDGGGALRYLDITAPPRRLAAALVPTMIGRPRPWMESAGYRSGTAERIALELNGPFMFDGEVFEPDPNTAVVLSTGPATAFVRL